MSITVNDCGRLFMFKLCRGDAARQQWQPLRYTLGQDSVAFTSTQLAAHLALTIMCLMLLIISFIAVTMAQINLGQISLQPRQEGGFDLGMSQGANIFGFGGHRALGVSSNSAGVGISGTDNVIVANERIGVDSGLGVRQDRSVDLLSMLQLGNPNPMHPGGQLGSLIDNVKNFFAGIIPPLPVPAPAMAVPRRRHRPRPPSQEGVWGRKRRPRPRQEELWERSGTEPEPKEELWGGAEMTPAPQQAIWGSAGGAAPPQQPMWQIPQQVATAAPQTWAGAQQPQGPQGVWPAASRPHRVTTEGGTAPDGFLPRPWENQGNVGPVDGSAGLSHRITSTENPFPTLVPRESEQWSISQTTEEPDPFEFPKDRPRQLPGLVEMSRPS